MQHNDGKCAVPLPSQIPRVHIRYSAYDGLFEDDKVDTTLQVYKRVVEG